MRHPILALLLTVSACSGIVPFGKPDTDPPADDTPGDASEPPQPDESGSDPDESPTDDSPGDTDVPADTDVPVDTDPPVDTDLPCDPTDTCGATTLVTGPCPNRTTLTCDASTSCTTGTCGGLAYTCTNAGGTWAWRRTTGCDDGNACTFGDACLGGTCRGTAVTCTDTTCLDRSCNGTSTCSEAPRNVGLTCDDGNTCTLDETCDAFGTCGGGSSAASCGDGQCTCGETFASCAADCPRTPPSNACSTGTRNRDGCGSSRIIGRSQARTGWSSGSDNTCSASDRHEGDCSVFDVGGDHTYAIFLFAGERVNASLGVSTTRCTSGSTESYNARLKMKFNASTATSGANSCGSSVGCWAGPIRGQTFTNDRSYTATQDGWLFVIVDGGATAFDEDRGSYTLTVTLSGCADPTCGC